MGFFIFFYFLQKWISFPLIFLVLNYNRRVCSALLTEILFSPICKTLCVNSCYCYRRLENYQETSWSAMSGLENDLQQLEANLAKQFGEDGGEEVIENSMFIALCVHILVI